MAHLPCIFRQRVDPGVQRGLQGPGVMGAGDRGHHGLPVPPVGRDQRFGLGRKLSGLQVPEDLIDRRVRTWPALLAHRPEIHHAGIELPGGLEIPLRPVAHASAVVDPVGHAIVADEDVFPCVADHVPVPQERIGHELPGQLLADGLQRRRVPRKRAVRRAGDELRELDDLGRRRIHDPGRGRDPDTERRVDLVGGDLLADVPLRVGSTPTARTACLAHVGRATG